MMVDINLKSVFMVSRAAIPAMLESGGGAIVNTGTLAAVIGRPNSVAYGASKSSVLALTRVMAADYFRQASASTASVHRAPTCRCTWAPRASAA